MFVALQRMSINNTKWVVTIHTRFVDGRRKHISLCERYLFFLFNFLCIDLKLLYLYLPLGQYTELEVWDIRHHPTQPSWHLKNILDEDRGDIDERVYNSEHHQYHVDNHSSPKNCNDNEGGRIVSLSYFLKHLLLQSYHPNRSYQKSYPPFSCICCLKCVSQKNLSPL